jgi:hypothetical protein
MMSKSADFSCHLGMKLRNGCDTFQPSHRSFEETQVRRCSLQESVGNSDTGGGRAQRYCISISIILMVRMMSTDILYRGNPSRSGGSGEGVVLLAEGSLCIHVQLGVGGERV